MGKVFREPESSSTVEETIREYAAAIVENSTAILFSVVSGKLSEGINFSDNLCRLILLIGIPYPNPYTPEHKARQTYLEGSLVARGIPTDEARRKAAEGGEDSALRAVNQAIGRAVRHQGDWASIVLVDSRWGADRVRGKLAGWIKESVSGGSAFGEVVGKVGAFFRERRL
jgi:chromosome transmission fidelity protein 1